MFAEPCFVEFHAVQCNDPCHVVFQCHGGGLAYRMKRRDKDAELQWGAHRRSNALRNSNKAALTSSGRSCCNQCPAPSIITWRYGPLITSEARSERVNA